MEMFEQMGIDSSCCTASDSYLSSLCLHCYFKLRMKFNTYPIRIELASLDWYSVLFEAGLNIYIYFFVKNQTISINKSTWINTENPGY